MTLASGHWHGAIGLSMEDPGQIFHSDEFRDKLTQMPAKRQAEILLRVQLRYFLNYWGVDFGLIQLPRTSEQQRAWLNFARALLTYDYAQRSQTYDFKKLERVTQMYPSVEEAPDYAYPVEAYLPAVARFLSGRYDFEDGVLRGILLDIDHEISGREIYGQVLADVTPPPKDYQTEPLFEQIEVDGYRLERFSDNPRRGFPREFSFWREWYNGVLRGRRIGLELQRRVVDIDDADWARGIEHVANLIAKIKEELEVEDERSKGELRKQASRLRSRADFASRVARNTHDLIEQALKAYTREISNAVPDELEPLEQLSAAMNRIAIELAGNIAPNPEEEKLVELLSNLAHALKVLNARLTTAKNQIKAQSRQGIMAEGFYRTVGEGGGKFITSRVVWMGIGSGASLMLGPYGDAFVATLGDLYNAVIAPEHAAGGGPNVIRLDISD